MNAVISLPYTPDVSTQDRRHFLGGSDAGAILGLSPWRTPLDVYNEKTAAERPADDPKKAKIFRRGKILEPYVLDMLRDEKGIKVRAANARFIDPEFDFLACEVDAVTDDDEDIEIKTVHPFAAGEWGDENTDEIPDHYSAQAIHGLMVTRKRSRMVAALIGADDLRVFRVERDEETIVGGRQRLLFFWQCVQERTPPPPIRLSDLSKLYGVDAGQVLAVDNELRVLDSLARIRDLKERIKGDEKTLEAEEFIVKEFMKSAAVLTVANKKVCSWKTQSRKHIPVESVRIHAPELAARIETTIQTRVFRVA
jgi:putative phage-type endonuclease